MQGYNEPQPFYGPHRQQHQTSEMDGYGYQEPRNRFTDEKPVHPITPHHPPSFDTSGGVLPPFRPFEIPPSLPEQNQTRSSLNSNTRPSYNSDPRNDYPRPMPPTMNPPTMNPPTMNPPMVPMAHPGPYQNSIPSINQQPNYYGQKNTGQGYLGNYFTPGPGNFQMEATNLLVNSMISQVGAQLGDLGATSDTDGRKASELTTLRDKLVSPFKNLRSYFQVSHKSVSMKLLLLTFPFAGTKVPFTKGNSHNNSKWNIFSQSPVSNSNSKSGDKDCDPRLPDLYLPLMALITVVILLGVRDGTSNAFHPENLTRTASKSLGVLVAEALCCYSAAWLFLPTPVPFWHLVSFCGNKYINISLFVLLSLMNEQHFVNLVVLAILASFASVAMFTCCRQTLNLQFHSEYGVGHYGSKYSWGVALSQFPLVILLGQLL